MTAALGFLVVFATFCLRAGMIGVAGLWFFAVDITPAQAVVASLLLGLGSGLETEKTDHANGESAGNALFVNATFSLGFHVAAFVAMALLHFLLPT